MIRLEEVQSEMKVLLHLEPMTDEVYKNRSLFPDEESAIAAGRRIINVWKKIEGEEYDRQLEACSHIQPKQRKLMGL